MWGCHENLVWVLWRFSVRAWWSHVLQIRSTIGGCLLDSHLGYSCSIPEHFLWNLWWTRSHCVMFFARHFFFPLSVINPPDPIGIFIYLSSGVDNDHISIQTRCHSTARINERSGVRVFKVSYRHGWKFTFAYVGLPSIGWRCDAPSNGEWRLVCKLLRSVQQCCPNIVLRNIKIRLSQNKFNYVP